MGGDSWIVFLFPLVSPSFLLYEAVLVLEQSWSQLESSRWVTPFSLVKLLLYFHIMFSESGCEQWLIHSFIQHTSPNVYQVPGVLLGSVGSTTSGNHPLGTSSYAPSVVIHGKASTGRMSSHLYITCVSVCAGERHRIYSKMPFFRINAGIPSFRTGLRSGLSPQFECSHWREVGGGQARKRPQSNRIFTSQAQILTTLIDSVSWCILGLSLRRLFHCCVLRRLCRTRLCVLFAVPRKETRLVAAVHISCSCSSASGT